MQKMQKMQFFAFFASISNSSHVLLINKESEGYPFLVLDVYELKLEIYTVTNSYSLNYIVTPTRFISIFE